MVGKVLLLIFLSDVVLSEKKAVSEQRVVIHHLKSDPKESSHGEDKKEEHHEEYAWSYPSYEFSYKVKDPETHDEKGQHEKREGDEVKGLYWLIEPNGHKRTVNYEANDHKGFHAQVDYLPKEDSYEHESNNIKHTYEVVEIIEGDSKSDVKQDDDKASDKQGEFVSEQQNNAEDVTQVNASENDRNGNDNNEAGENSVNNNEGEMSNQNENNEEPQIESNNINENKNELSDAETQSEGKVKVRRENKGYHANTYNRHVRSRIRNRVKNSIQHEPTKHGKNAVNRNDQHNDNQKINENNTRANRNVHPTDSKIQNKNTNKEYVHVPQGDKNEEYNSGLNLKGPKTNMKIPKNENKQKNSTLENTEENNKDPYSNEENVKYEHRIRIHHPKPVAKKSHDTTKKH